MKINIHLQVFAVVLPASWAPARFHTLLRTILCAGAMSLIFTVRNSSYGKVMFLHVYVCPRGDGGVMRGMCGRGHAWREFGGVCVTGETATAADGMHPTGMHSC